MSTSTSPESTIGPLAKPDERKNDTEAAFYETLTSRAQATSALGERTQSGRVTATADRCYAVLDVGGTSIKIGAVLGRHVATRPAVASHATTDQATVLHQLNQAIADATACAEDLGGSAPSGLAVAFPGPFDVERGTPMIRGLGKFDSIFGIDLRR